MEKKLVVIAGPTACGKTEVSVKLADKINGEIISADSIQIYKYMDIGSAKIMPEQMNGIKHYLIDELEPDQEYNVAIFQKKAKEYIKSIYTNNKIPILVGGTGFYINAVIYDNNFENVDSDYKYRKELEKIAKEKGNDFLYDMLKECDFKATETIHQNNIKRVIRALEYYKQTGKTISKHNEEEKQRKSPYNVIFFVLYMDREFLYNKINNRVDKMIKNGLVDEVKMLMDKYSSDIVSMQGLGYKEIVQYLKGNITFDEAVYILKRNTRRFAKRQITWFKNQCDGIWIDVTKYKDSKELCDKLYSIYNTK